MNERAFWYVDDEHRVRWAVHIRECPGEGAEIVFTCWDHQLSTVYSLAKRQQQLSRPELLELLRQAKAEGAAADAGLFALPAA